MKTKIYTLCFIILFVTFAYAQDNRLIYSKEAPRTAEKAKAILQKSDAYVSVHFVNIDLEKIPNHEQFTLQFEGRNILVNKVRIITRGANNYSFVGNNEKGESVLLSVLDGDIQGVIETSTGVFSVETIGKNEYVIIKVDQSKLKDGCQHMENQNPSTVEHQNDLSIVEVDTTTSHAPKSTRAYSCKIRVLVLYTQSAKSLIGNIQNMVNLAIDLTNVSFTNSGINYQIELAYAGLTSYTESGNYQTDLNRFRNTADGYMDEVSTLRNKYSADVNVLLTNDPTVCGVATLNAVESTSFAVVSVVSTCATTNYSFGHEIGHILGCHHDPATNQNIHFPYGHGYVYGTNQQNGWRTIMAYGNACANCQRLQYWSNPNVRLNGEPMGTVNIHNNARVWNERSNTVMTFRQPSNNITVTNGDIANSTYADVVAKQTINTSGTVNVSSGKSLIMRATNSITITDGFTVQAGASFSAKIENVTDCGN